MRKKVKRKEFKVVESEGEIFLIGNGINRTSSEKEDKYEWGNLLKDLNEKFASNNIKNIRDKPFPMVYDEIINYTVKSKNHKENEVKKFIKAKLDLLKSNSKYKNLKHLSKSKHILTTNYDYLIEKNISENWQRNPINKKEYFYSIYRYQNCDDKKVWHIHGEQGDQRSILLGFSHYIDYATKVKSRAELFIQGLPDNVEHNDPSWVDLFFTHNINIIGLGMSFTEYPLWWLIAYRNKQILFNDMVELRNKIRFFTPEFNEDKNLNLSHILKGYDVEYKTENVENYDYDSFYNQVLSKFN